jgi:hypothetical protein
VHPATFETIPAFVALPNKVHQGGREDSSGFGAWRTTPNAADAIMKGCNRSHFLAQNNDSLRADQAGAADHNDLHG